MIEINNLTKNKINEKEIKNLVNIFLGKYKIKDNLSIAIIGDSRMREINYLYRGYDKTTDVLSFGDLNEILLNFSQIRRQAKEYNKETEEEFYFILVHGLLHLAGFCDEKESDRLKMIDLGNKFLSKYNKSF
ncbi:rRNA maturation RNase YbeY [Candidatus Falkowbacteria bacterium HGW-Falkowbacteria-1]|uniref:Endoribonuclease YbeY n=1 Tax=Candidatus Falkowbacteria bacterium HGW-Falkowbacteria-1 TaxID=2013768 RepID=A0A2N2EAU8_9BACT|nr:MAG: rRNA maturation RNase YbeY [Candidatus Falkowbacteria bacterium HGW-Falkowbacteria-1]